MTKKTSTKKNIHASGGKLANRPQPLTPRAGFRKDGHRYGCGGKLSK